MDTIVERQARYDNAKFFLVGLIVLGHTIEPLILDSQAYRALYVFIYLFHIPAFSLIAGYFSTAEHSVERLLKLVRRLLVPYMVFQCLYATFIYGLKGTFSLDLLTPYWIMWFLPSLLIWGAVLPLVMRLTWPLVTAVGLSVFAGYFDGIGYGYGVSRTIVFFPYFLAGHLIASRAMKIETIFATKLRAVLFVGVAGLIAWLAAPQVDPTWLWGAFSYSALGSDQLYAGMFRLALFGVSLGVAIGFIVLVPGKHTFVSDYGTRSLYVYLLHGFVLLWLRETALFARPNDVIPIVLAVALTLTLATPLVRRMTRLLVEPAT